MRKTASVLSLFLAVGIAAVGLPGCSNRKTGTQSDQYANTPMEVSVEIFDRGLCPASEGSMENNRWTKWVNEQSGVKVNWVAVPRNQDTDKIRAMFAAGTAPDIVWEYPSSNFIASLVDQGVLQTVDKYIDQYSTAYKKYINDNPDLKPYTQFDGKTYAFTSKRSLDMIANHGMWIRQDWLDKLGLKAPTNVDELLKVAEEFTRKDPDGNGKNDTYGFNTLDMNYVRQWYGCQYDYYDGSTLIASNTNVYTTDRFRDAWQFRKTAYDEGLFDKEYITDKDGSRAKQLFDTGRVGIYIGGWNISSDYLTLKQNVPTANLVALEPPSSKYGHFGMYQETPALRQVAFNKSMKNPKAGVKFLDWLIDKGWKTLTYGTEGEYYRDVNGIPQTIDANKSKVELNYATQDYPLLSQKTFKPSWFPTMASQDAVSQEYAKKETTALALQLKNVYPRIGPYQYTSSAVTQFNTDMSTVWQDMDAKVTMGGSQYSVAWGVAQLKSQVNRLGGDTITKDSADYYKQNKDAFSKWVKEYNDSLKQALKE